MAETDYPEETLSVLLAAKPPYSTFIVREDVVVISGGEVKIDIPSITLYCDSDDCGGPRSHDIDRDSNFFTCSSSGRRVFVGYTCRHCKRVNKLFALLAYRAEGAGAYVTKIGELPQFGPHTPAAVLRLLGEQKEFYLKGRRAESQGLGIAAFAYYRRVVENHKAGFIDEVIRVAKHLQASPAILAQLAKAKEEISFEKSVDAINDAIPPALLLRGGHNPLRLLHHALSEGLHNDDDDECLELATHIRVVLLDFVERMQNAMKETAELNQAVTKLLEKRAAKSVKGEKPALLPPPAS